MSAFAVVELSLSMIKTGDTVIHEEKEMTVSRGDIKSGFMGRTLFGDSYMLGQKKVKKLVYTKREAEEKAANGLIGQIV